MAILMVPGFNGSEAEHWQSRWEAALGGVERVQQEHWDAPEFDVWLAVLAHHVRSRPGAVLVGHSLGATLIAHMAVRHPDLDVGGALLVAPADPDVRRSRVPGIASFGPLPIEPLGFPAILVASRTDPHMAQIVPGSSPICGKQPLLMPEMPGTSTSPPAIVPGRRGFITWPACRSGIVRSHSLPCRGRRPVRDTPGKRLAGCGSSDLLSYAAKQSRVIAIGAWATALLSRQTRWTSFCCRIATL